MTENNMNTNETEIKRYLYNEMSDEERAGFEENFFADDELFFKVVNLENDLVDRYASGKLAGEELARFERSLENLPERGTKVANAIALQTFIREEKPQESPISAASSQSFWQRLSGFFTIKTPAFGYTMAGVLLLLTLSSIFLLLDNRRKTDELVRLQTERQVISQQKENDLQNELVNSQKREVELKNQIDDERETSGDLTDELEGERRKRGEIESELKRLRLENSARPSPTQQQQQTQTPIIASIFLSPGIATRGGGTTSETKNFSVERGTKRIAVRLALPADANKSDRFSVRLNEKTVARDLAMLISSGGQKAVQLTTSPNEVLDGANEFIVLSAAGAEISKYIFYMQKK
jgi:hypothetical protein